jgi:hypothetical protein
MSTLLQNTKSELRRAGLFDPDADFDGDVAACVTAMMQTFVAYGHSGGSAEATLQVFDRLARHLPLAPLTGDDDEWDDPSGDGKLLQNTRCTRVFKDTESGIAFDTRNGAAARAQPLSFPYAPPLE